MYVVDRTGSINLASADYEENPKMARLGSPFFNGFPIIGKFDPLTAHFKTP
jgi:hypothetical protein